MLRIAKVCGCCSQQPNNHAGHLQLLPHQMQTAGIAIWHVKCCHVCTVIDANAWAYVVAQCHSNTQDKHHVLGDWLYTPQPVEAHDVWLSSAQTSPRGGVPASSSVCSHSVCLSYCYSLSLTGADNLGAMSVAHVLSTPLCSELPQKRTGDLPCA